MGRFLAVCGWLAWQIGRPFGMIGLRRVGRGPSMVLAALLVGLAMLPIAAPLLDPQPEDVIVQQIFDGTISHPEGWVRLRGRITPLAESPTGQPGSFGLLIDAENPLRAVVIVAQAPVDTVPSIMVTGHLAERGVIVEEELPVEATVAGTAPQVARDRVVTLDQTPTAVRLVWWPLSILPALLAAMLVIGSRVGYPIFRPTSEVDVLTSPLSVGERIPSAFGGRIGSNERDLADPGGALLLVRRGPRGSLLTAQPLTDDAGPAPAPVTIGGSWTSGRIGLVHTVRETIPALQLRSEEVDAIFLFARAAERDRVAALVAVDR